MGLTNKQRLFVEYYLQTWNASEAARRAGYSEKTAHSQGPRLLENVEIGDEIKARVDAQAMTAGEALVRLAEQARAAYAAYIESDGSVDLAGMKRDGKMHLVKCIKYTRTGEVMVEFHDAQAALFKVTQVHGLPIERVEATVDDKRTDVRRRIDDVIARLRTGNDSGGVDAGPSSGGGA
jgi:hypothetical protein